MRHSAVGCPRFLGSGRLDVGLFRGVCAVIHFFLNPLHTLLEFGDALAQRAGQGRNARSPEQEQGDPQQDQQLCLPDAEHGPILSESWGSSAGSRRSLLTAHAPAAFGTSETPSEYRIGGRPRNFWRRVSPPTERGTGHSDALATQPLPSGQSSHPILPASHLSVGGVVSNGQPSGRGSRRRAESVVALRFPTPLTRDWHRSVERCLW